MSKKHLSAEVLRLKENLICGNCEKTFTGSDSQAYKVKYDKAIVYCCADCRKVGLARRSQEREAAKPITPPKLRTFGPCPTCNEMFKSRTKDKIYCSMKCYHASDKFKEHLANNRILSLTPEARARLAETNRTGVERPCVGCGKPMYVKNCKKDQNTYCSHACYRSYMDNRFERNQVTPELKSLPKDYQEFLDDNILECIVKGCNWKGQHLSLHCNLAHGITADTFKRLAGFNLGEGIIGADLANRLRARETFGVALDPMNRGDLQKALDVQRENREKGVPQYVSLQAKENRARSRQYTLISKVGPGRLCVGCGLPFVQSTPFGRAMYCTIECRDQDYARLNNQRRLDKHIVPAAPEWVSRRNKI